jgi:integrase
VRSVSRLHRTQGIPEPPHYPGRFNSGLVSVKRTLVGIRDTAPVFTDPKTPRSRRTFKVSSVAVDAFRRLRDRQAWERQVLGEAYANYGLVFATPLGTPLDAANVLKRFKRALNAAGLSDKYTFHSLRHTAATTMLEAGINPKTVADRLGHTSVGFTMDRYCHAVKSLDEDAAERLQDVLDRSRRRDT